MPRDMQRALFAIAATLGAALLGSGTARAELAAYGQGRYCAVVSNGTGSAKEICNFNDFEACRLEVVSGNRGFYRNNAYVWAPAHDSHWVGEPGVRRLKHKRRHL